MSAYPSEFERRAHVDVLIKEAQMAGLRIDDLIRHFGVVKADSPVVQAAELMYCDKGVVEIDDRTLIDDTPNGTWVMAWVFVCGDQDAI